MYKNQTPTKGQSWIFKFGSVMIMVALLISTLGFVFSNVDANTTTSSPENSHLPKFLAADSVIGDDTTAEFTQGDLNSCSYVSETANGELILKPTVGAEFSGATLPTDWVATPWQLGGDTTVSGGAVSIDESLLATTDYYTPGHVLDFVATFQPDVNDHAGWIVDLDASLNYAMFSLGSPGGTIIKARTKVGGGDEQETSTTYTAGSPHHFRIAWTNTQVIYYIDDMGTPVATHDASFVTDLRPGFSDLTPSDPADLTKKLVVDWVRMSPYTTPCTFTSRVLDAGAAANWKMLSWTANLPSGTSLAFSYQFGNADTPDSTWSSFISVPSSGTALTGRARYVRYRVVLSTSDPAVAPEVLNVQFTYHTEADTTAPVILSSNPASGATGISRNTDVTVTFSKLLSATTVDGTSATLRDYGTGINVPATVALSAGNVITIHPSAALALGTTYAVTIKASVADLANTPLGTDAVWYFTTTPSATDTTTVDFQGGTGCYLADTSGGEVILAPALGAEFSGSSLPAGWTGTSGSTVVGNGLVSVENGRVYYSAASFSPGHTLEFTATFTASQYQNVGWADETDFLASYAMFSTKDTTTDLYARTSDLTDIPIAGSYIGSPHRYRIDWTSTDVTFYVDGTQVAQHSVDLTDPMFPIASDNTVDGQAVQVDWMRMSPYTSPCTFTSRVMNAGASVLWNELTWVGSGTGIALSYRSGNSATPDGTWTGFTAAPSSPTTLNVTSHYIQYRADLTTTDSNITPVLESVTFTSTPINYAPVLGNIGSRSIDELATLTFTATATDVNLPGDILTYSLLDAPTGAGINSSSGAFSWTPTEVQGPGSYPFTIKVCDNGVPSLCDQETITVTVNEVNVAPVLGSIGNRSVDELATLSFTATATDVDRPANTLTFSLEGAPTGAGINASSGAFSWTPTEAQGPGSFQFKVKVCDNGTPTLCDDELITVTVTAVNDPPVITEGTWVNVVMSVNGVPTAFNLTLHATDPDVVDTLTWSILTQATHGAASASGTGASQAIDYTPDTDYTGTDSFVVQVSDGNGGTDTITVNVSVGVVTLTISGNAGLPGVTITYTGGSTTTDASGDYTFTVAFGWTGTITPSLAGYAFTPTSMDLTNVIADQSGVNFTATPVNYPVYLPLIMQN